MAIRTGWFLTVLAVALFGLGKTVSAVDPIKSLETVLEPINAISATYVLTYEAPAQKALSWRSLQRGELLLVSIDSKPSGEGLSPLAGWWSFDGDRYLHPHLDPKDPSKILAVESKGSDEDSVPNIRRDFMLPLQFVGKTVCRTREALVDLLRKPETRYVGTEVVVGQNCLRFEVPEIRMMDGTGRQLFVWLDPKFQFLPRKVVECELGIPLEKVGKTADRGWYELEITRFASIPDEAAGDRKPFPEEAIIVGSAGRATYRFDSVRLNPALEKKMFQPVVPPGTTWILRDPGRRERTVIADEPPVVASPATE